MQSIGEPSERSIPSDLHAVTLKAFYSRLIQRVCSSYREQSESSTDEDMERLRQKWQEKLALYTGKHTQSNAMAEINSNGISTVGFAGLSRDGDIEALDDEDEFSIPSSSNSSSHSSLSSPIPSFIESEASTEQITGRPSAQVPSTATSTASSIFSKMLGTKRKLHQLDGSVSDDGDTVEWQDADVQEVVDTQFVRMQQKSLETSTPPLAASMTETHIEDNAGSETEDEILHDIEEEKEDKASSSSVDSASLLVSAQDFSPVSGLSGINLPLQLAAQYSKFIHRGKRRGYFGQLHSIVLTWPSRLAAKDSILPGDMVWCCPDSERGFLDEGEVVKVVSLGDTLDELKIERSNGAETTVQLHRVRRLKEYLIRKGSVRFRSEQ
ncbi:hypothetical protein F441_22040 [Phytophthora nicotianae CJ01A1]|uniref:Uncharacterized protein n=1 Tax=Phytophthora nicotianae CJ01A1 TaxID=1317063 RepID=W2VS86_PHYNI|nr:hypothetical protein F441_22040 [Phytophthora nicotianae CJ01A1]